MDIKAFEDKVTGRTSRMRELYRAAFSETEAEAFARETKKQNRKVALLLLFVIFIAVLASYSESQGGEGAALDLVRPSIGDKPKTIEANVSAEYDGHIVRQRALLRIQPRLPSEVEAEAALSGLKQRLPDLILGHNASISDVRQDLFLPIMDGETGAELSWSSSDARVVARDGSVNLVGVEHGTVVTLTAYMSLASSNDTFFIAVKTGAGVPEENMEGALKDRMAEAVKETANGRDGEAVSLPDRTGDGVNLTWSPPEQSGGLPLIFGCVLIAAFCYSRRYSPVRRNIDKARAEMERDFPGFIQKLGLLLGAGLVITSAINRIVEDYQKTCDVYGKKRLYEELISVREHMRGAGTSLVFEFAELARRSGLRELMRFSSTLSDNIDKGSTLADKLRAENELLWEGRKKRAEKEGRLAETKLIFPMVLQILAIIAVTVMPAAFEMG